MKIPFFNYPHVFTAKENEFLRVLKDVGSRGAFIMQQDLQNFEQRLASYCGVKYAVGVANATDGLQLGLMAGGIEAGDEIIICSHTMIATASAIHFAGAIPVPVEVGSDHTIDPDAITGAITPKTKAIMPTQLNGRIADMAAIQSIADQYGLDIYEDAAQALGAKFQGQYAGTFGKCACISFYPAKILGGLGDGGLVLTADKEIYDKLLLLRDHGRANDGDVTIWGFNSRLDNLQAAFLNFQFDNYEQVITRRREIAAQYQELLKDVDQVDLPPGPSMNSDHFDVFQNYEIEAEQRDKLKAFLADNGIGTLIQWGGKAVHQFTKLGFDQVLPFTEEVFTRLLLLPLNMSITDAEVNYVAEKIIAFYRNNEKI